VYTYIVEKGEVWSPPPVDKEHRSQAPERTSFEEYPKLELYFPE